LTVLGLFTDFLFFSENFKFVVPLLCFRKLVENVSFFKDLPANQVIKIISCIKRELCLSNDVIFRFNELGSCLYFIKTGAVALYTPKGKKQSGKKVNPHVFHLSIFLGKEVLHLEDGDFFGEAALLFDNRRRMGTMVAIETSELYILNRKNFDLLILPHPELVKALEMAAINRINNMFGVEERSNNDQSHLEERIGM
jgi:CRP-like cAMP-binding protein